MASTIIIKNGAGSSTPSSLKQGELAINVDNGKLFYGTSGSSNAVSSSFSFQHVTASGEVSASKVIADIISGGGGNNNTLDLGDPDGNQGGVAISLTQTNNTLGLTTQTGGFVSVQADRFQVMDAIGNLVSKIELRGA